MRTVNTFAALCAAALSLQGCQLNLDSTPQAQLPVATASPVTSSSCNSSSQYCTKVQGQLFYSATELMAAPITNHSLSLRYNVSDFKIFLIGSRHAYSGTTDLKGNFSFTNVEPGQYTLIARFVPATGSDLFYDCQWITSTGGVNNNGVATGVTSVCQVTDATPYRLGVYEDNITVEDNKVSLVSLITVQKLWVDNSGFISGVQAVTSDNSAPKQNWTGPALNIGKAE